MRRRPPGSTRTDTLFPDTTLDRSKTSMESPLSDDWSVMESSLRSEARYLNPKVVQFMKSIFDDIADDVTVDGASVLVDAGPGSAYEQLFRARVFQSERSLIDALQHPERLDRTRVV